MRAAHTSHGPSTLYNGIAMKGEGATARMRKNVSEVMKRVLPLLKHPVSRNVSWVTGEHFLAMVISLVTTALVARHLGVAGFGKYCLAIAFPQMLRVFTHLGLGQIVLRDLAQRPDEKERIQGSMAGLYALTGLATTALIIGLAHLLKGDNPEIIHLVSIASLSALFAPQEVFKQWFQSQLRSKYAVIVGTTVLILVSCVKIALTFADAGISAFVWANVLSSGLGALGMMGIYWKVYGSPLGWHLDPSYVRSTLVEGWPKLGTALVNTLGRRSDQVMLGVLAGPEAVAIYAVAFRLQQKLVFLPGIVANSLAPGLSRAKRLSDAAFMKKLLASYRVMVLVFLAIGIPLAIASPLLILGIYGEEYRMATPILMLFSGRLLFVCITSVRSWYITNEKLFAYNLGVGILASLTNLLLNFALIPSFGAVGATIATLAAAFTGSMLCDWVVPTARRNAKTVGRGLVTPFSGVDM